MKRCEYFTPPNFAEMESNSMAQMHKHHQRGHKMRDDFPKCEDVDYQIDCTVTPEKKSSLA